MGAVSSVYILHYGVALDKHFAYVLVLNLYALTPLVVFLVERVCEYEDALDAVVGLVEVRGLLSD
jgi:hypothetical protein